jgi:hypothetical protein
MLPLGLHLNWHEEDAIIYVTCQTGRELTYTPFPWAAVNNGGKSYNIRMDDEILVQFSPKTPTSSYFFGNKVRA